MMEMKNLKELIKRFEETNHPAQALGKFLLKHSNSPDYLIAALGAFLQAAEADRAAEIEMMKQLLPLTMNKENNNNVG